LIKQIATSAHAASLGSRRFNAILISCFGIAALVLATTGVFGVMAYYERSRTHLALDKDAPIPRPIAAPADGRVVAIPQVGGLHHRYERRAA
jgi:hypothetical protein